MANVTYVENALINSLRAKIMNPTIVLPTYVNLGLKHFSQSCLLILNLFCILFVLQLQFKPRNQ